LICTETIACLQQPTRCEREHRQQLARIRERRDPIDRLHALRRRALQDRLDDLHGVRHVLDAHDVAQEHGRRARAGLVPVRCEVRVVEDDAGRVDDAQAALERDALQLARVAGRARDRADLGSKSARVSRTRR
jgi:hypothetical protein